MNQEVEFINFSPERVIEVAVNILYGNDNEVLVVESNKNNEHNQQGDLERSENYGRSNMGRTGKTGI